MKYRFTILSVFLFFAGAQVYAQCAGPITYTESPAPGPGNTYPPGQVVDFCVTVNGFDENVSNWLHGLTLEMGPGWDVNSVIVISYPTPANPTTGSSPDSPNVWGYFPGGVTSALPPNPSFGAGFYFETGESDGANNGVYDGNPGDNYGDYCPSQTCVWTFCFSIEVSPSATPGTSLSFSVLPTGDGTSGDWSGGQDSCNDPPTAIFTTTTVGGSGASITSTNVTCFGFCNGTAIAAGHGGTPPYNYKWNTGPTTPALSNLCPATYTCTVTDAASYTATASVNITQPTQLMLTGDSIINPTCNGSCNGAVITQVTGGTTPYNYTWVGGAAPNSAVDYSMCAGLAKLTVTDSNLCVIKDSFTLTQPPPGQVNLVSQTNVICRGENTGSITVSYSGGSGGPVTYAWSNGESGASDTALAAGNHTVTATDSVGCTATATYTITQPANGITLQNPVIIPATCFGDNNGAIAANATGGSGALTYNWIEPSDSTQYSGADISNLGVGTYILTVADTSGCSLSASYQVTSPPAIIIDSIVAHNVVCFGDSNGSANIYAHGGIAPLHYQWSVNPADMQSSVTGLSVGTVSVTIADANHCSVSDSTTITQTSTLSITTINQTNEPCFGLSDGSITVLGNGGTPPYTYVWSNGSHVPIDSALIAGTYALTLADASQCTSVQLYTITQPPVISVNPVVDNILCFGAANGQIDANPSGGTSPYFFQWSNGDSAQIADSLAPGTYTGTITDDNGCTVMLTESVTQAPKLNILYTPFAVKCIGQQNGYITVSLTGGTPPYGYSVTQDSVNFIYGSDDSITMLDTGAYVILFNDSNGCTQERSTYVPNATPNVFATTADSTSCYGADYNDGSVLVTVISTQNSPYQYSIDNSLEHDTNYFSNLSAGTHSIIATNTYGCPDTILVTVYQPAQIQVSLQQDSIILNLGSGKSIVVNYLNASNPVFSWTPSLGLSCADCPNPVVSPYTSGNYTITVSEQKATATCYGYDTLYVVVNPFTPVFIPTAFSPNGDGNNDVFKIYGDNISAVSLKIFNRWGELVYASTNAQAGWDGTYKGQLQEPNVYTYEATITFLDNSQVQRSGSVTLVR